MFRKEREEKTAMRQIAQEFFSCEIDTQKHQQKNKQQADTVYVNSRQETKHHPSFIIEQIQIQQQPREIQHDVK